MISYMRFIVIFKKELLEYSRSKKLVAVLLIFSFFGIVSPLTAYFLPDIMEHFTKSQNVNIDIPAPTYDDAVFQYIKNLSQMCVFILILMNMGIISGEKEKGTAVFLLVKPVKRSSFILAKFSAVFTITVTSICLSALFTAFYTFLFFDTLNIFNFIVQNLLITLYILCVMSITLMFSTIARSQILSGILTFFMWISFSIFAQFGEIGRYSPDGLISAAFTFPTTGQIFPESIVLTALIILLSIVVSLSVFEKWEPK
ncbi:MAG: ABC transporter permease subunit [Bacteroidales bacterium]|nr:ABC transporter permease subunit [Bacteroidales bacterium]